MKVTFLGTNGWYDTLAGNTICILVQAGEWNIILDAGNGLHRADEHIKDDGPIHMFLSHFHLDHIEGLHILSKFRFRGGLRIYGQPGTAEILSRIVAEPFTVPLERLPYRAEVFDLQEGVHDLPFRVEVRELFHASRCFGYRFEINGRVLAYIPDTGVCDNAFTLARGADLMIAECAHRPGEENPEWPHLNPESAAMIASRAGARRLALVHFDARRYPTIDDRFEAVRGVKGLEGFEGLVVGVDGMTLDV